MLEPQEIEEYEQVLERVAAIDVAKASGMVCKMCIRDRVGADRADADV